MDGWVIFCAVLLVVIIIVSVIALAFPPVRRKWQRYRCRGKQCPPVPYNKTSGYALGVRIEDGSGAVLPQIVIDNVAVTRIPLNRPDPSVTGVPITRSGNYQLMYSVQVTFLQDATVSGAIQYDVGTAPATMIPGSSTQITGLANTSGILAWNFMANLHKNSIIYLVCQADIANAVVVPASNVAVLQTPTTLAAITVFEVSQSPC